ncbi:MAG: T9SS type A sorting domain-containing protein, partial [Bacteroidales bacterium]|nr:T9SS type A sorting domain-containing protein [Bacteroidales bacterium]
QLDRVMIINHSKGWQEFIYWPDTVLTLQIGTGIDEMAFCETSPQLFQNNPNPFNGITDVILSTPYAGDVTMEITDVAGHIVGTHRVCPQPGMHQFRITLSAPGTYVLTARQNGKTSSIKMVNTGGGNANSMDYVGMQETCKRNPQSDVRGLSNNPFSLGDNMEYHGFATINGQAETGQTIAQPQSNSQTFIFYFDAVQMFLANVITSLVSGITQTEAVVGGEVISDGGEEVTDRGVCWNTVGTPTITDSCIHLGNGLGAFSDTLSGLSMNTVYYVRAYAINNVGVSYGETVSFVTLDQSCPGTPTVTDIDNNTYATVQIGNQCWMKENLRTTKYADGTEIEYGNDVDFSYSMAYYYYDPSSDVQTYGLLYNWKAMMGDSATSFSNPSGVQGICPNGWHVPSDAEWEQLLEYVSSQSQYVCGTTSTNIAKALAAKAVWPNISSADCAIGNNQDANDATGFGAMPAGYYSGLYYDFGARAHYWCSSQQSATTGFYRGFFHDNAEVIRSQCEKYYAKSVRCVKD